LQRVKMSTMKAAVVMDIGSGFTKSGVAGELAPRSIISSSVGRITKNDNGFATQDSMEFTFPMDQGIISNWDDYVNLIHATYVGELGLNPSERPLMQTVPIQCTRQHKEKLTEISFEEFNIPSICTQLQPTMALFESGRISGTVIDSGETLTYSVSISRGICQPDSLKKMTLAGRDVRDVLKAMLVEKGYRQYDNYTLQNIKENYCYINTKLPKDKVDYRLPDGKVITLDRERYLCGEILFNPFLVKQSVSIQSLINPDRDANVLLTGGCVLMPGFTQRFVSQIPRDMEVITSSHTQIAAWVGASMYAKNNRQWISNRDYQEIGARAVHFK